MPLCEHGATELRRPHKSRLGESLLRLQHSLEQTRSSERTAEDQFQNWQERWMERREQISRRLELIDRQLEALVQSYRHRPHLSVVAHSHDD